MITTRRGKREGRGLFSHELVFDLLEEERPIGRLVYDGRERRGTLALGERSFVIARRSQRGDELPYQMLLRLLTGRPKPPPNPMLLADAAGAVLAEAEPRRGSFAVSRGTERYTLRRAGAMQRPFRLYPEGSDQPLGSVGQAKLLTTSLHADFPPQVDAAFQLFLLVLVIDLSLQQAQNNPS
jgi:hypothetical protein